MNHKKLIVVAGATGAQGGGLVRAILNDPQGPLRVRALTRDSDSEKALRLRQAGAEVVTADFDDRRSLRQAFRDAHGAYFMTNFWEHFSPDKELAQAANMADAARDAGLAHVIWSTLEDTRKWVPLEDQRMPTLMGKYKVPHFDAKGEADQLFIDRDVPTTFLLTSFYWENLIHFGMGPKPGPDGVLAIIMPLGEKKLPGIAVEDIGRCACSLFKKGRDVIGRRIAIAGGHLSGAEMAAALSRALGRQVVYNDVPARVYRQLGFPGAEDLGNMFQFKRDFNDEYCGVRDIKATRELNPALQSFDEWLARNKDRIALE